MDGAVPLVAVLVVVRWRLKGQVICTLGSECSCKLQAYMPLCMLQICSSSLPGCLAGLYITVVLVVVVESLMTWVLFSV